MRRWGTWRNPYPWRHVLISRFLVNRILRVDELEFLGHRGTRAKYAAVFSGTRSPSSVPGFPAWARAAAPAHSGIGAKFHLSRSSILKDGLSRSLGHLSPTTIGKHTVNTWQTDAVMLTLRHPQAGRSHPQKGDEDCMRPGKDGGIAGSAIVL